MSKRYTKEFLISELHRFVRENDRDPIAKDMKRINGYPSYDVYVTTFDSWVNACNVANINVSVYKYTDIFLLNELERFVIENGHPPTESNLINSNNYPSPHAYITHFGSFNKALILANLTINHTTKYKYIATNENCYICGSSESYRNSWVFVEDHKICNKCRCGPRKYFHGILNPNTKIGTGIITENVVNTVLGDSYLHNTIEHFNCDYDLTSKSLGTINVKSSLKQTFTDYNGEKWIFHLRKNSKTPHHYICIGFDTVRTKIERVWIIPGDASICGTHSISISNSTKSLSRATQYEVDPEPYNKVYQQLDIYTLPEFCNLKPIEA